MIQEGERLNGSLIHGCAVSPDILFPPAHFAVQQFHSGNQCAQPDVIFTAHGRALQQQVSRDLRGVEYRWCGRQWRGQPLRNLGRVSLYHSVCRHRWLIHPERQFREPLHLDSDGPSGAVHFALHDQGAGVTQVLSG